MRPSPPGLVIFDCDGVLVDSEVISNPLFVAHLNRAGFAVTLEEANRDLIGKSMASCMALLKERFGRPLPDRFLDELQAETFEALAAGVRPVEGVVEALDRIEAAGIATCVASSGDHGKMAVTLGATGLLGRFRGRIFSATDPDVARGKPFPDLFLLAAARLGQAPEACAVVEDSVPGTEAAVAAGMRALSYAGSPIARVEAMRAAGGTLFKRMVDLPGLLGL